MEITETTRKQLKSATEMISQFIPQCFDTLKAAEDGAAAKESPKKKAKTEKSGKARKATDAPKKARKDKSKQSEPEKAKESEPEKAKEDESDNDTSDTEPAKRKLDFEAAKHVRFDDSQSTEKNDTDSDKAAASQEST